MQDVCGATDVLSVKLADTACMAAEGAVEGFERTGDVVVGLRRSPAIARVAMDLVEPPGRCLLDQNPGHAVSPGCVRSRRRRSRGGWYALSGVAKAWLSSAFSRSKAS